MKKGKITGWIAASVAIVVWSVTFVNTRALLRDFSAIEIQMLRLVVAWVALAGIDAFAHRPEKGRCVRPTPRDELLFAGMGLTGVAVYQFLENCAVYYTNASNVAILVSFCPIVTAVFARFLANDRSLSVPFVAGALVAVGGVALVSLNGVVNPADMRRPILGSFMALGAMCSWGVYSVLVDKANARGLSQSVAIRKAFFWALAVSVPLALWGMTRRGAAALDGSFGVTLGAAANAARFADPLNWLNLGVLGLLGSALCFVIWNHACRELGMVRTTVGLYLMPFIGTLFAAFFLGERMTAMGVAGGVVIIAGVAMANFRRQGPAPSDGDAVRC